jgi:hypothetical protein
MVAFLAVVGCRTAQHDISATAPDAGPDSGAASVGSSDGPGPDRPGSDLGATSVAETYARAGVVIGSCMADDGLNRNVARFWDPLAGPTFWHQFRRQAQCLATAGGGCAWATRRSSAARPAPPPATARC